VLLNWDDRGVEVLIWPESEEHLQGAHYGWLKGLRVTAGGTGIASHAGVALLRALADNTA
jgi:hypothetical protein